MTTEAFEQDDVAWSQAEAIEVQENEDAGARLLAQFDDDFVTTPDAPSPAAPIMDGRATKMEDIPPTPQQRMRETVSRAGEELPKGPPDPEAAAKHIVGVLEGTVDLVRDLPDAAIRGLVSSGAEAAFVAGLLSKEQITEFRRIVNQMRERREIPAPGAEEVETITVDPLTPAFSEVTEVLVGLGLPSGALFAGLKAIGAGTKVSLVLAEGIAAAVTQNPETVDVYKQVFSKPPDDPMWAELDALLRIDPDDTLFEERAKVFAQNAGLAGAFVGLLPALKLTARAIRDAPEISRRLGQGVREFARDISGEVPRRSPLVAPIGRRGAEGEFEIVDAITGRVHGTAKTEAEAQRMVNKLDPEGETDIGYVRTGEGHTAPAPVYFSQSGNAIAGAKFDKGTAAQWLALQGLKKEEIEFTGLKQFLEGKQGAVSKDEVLDFLDKNQVRVEEVVKGGRELGPDDYDELYELFARRDREEFDIAFDEAEGGYTINLYGEPEYDFGGSIRVFNSADEAEEHLMENLRNSARALPDEELLARVHGEGAEPQISPGGPTKFSSWQLPGGENYRELLITLPSRFKAIEDELTVLFRQGDGRTIESLPLDVQSRVLALREEKRSLGSAPDFTSSHFDEPNVLAHIRFNERTTADGKRVLFIEEVQSDWHQQGRKRGYGDKRIYELYEDGDLRGQFHTREAAETAARERNYQHMGIQERTVWGDGVPDAPFKKTWHELALKRMIRYAADNDFDAIAWTPGKVQVDRYEDALRKAVDEVHWTKTDEGVHLVGYKGSRAQAQFGDVATESNKVVDTTEKEDALSDAIGKAMAKDILGSSEQSGVIRGDGIRMDDTGMAGFYDRMLVRAADRLGKKFGAKTGEVEIGRPAATEADFRLLDDIANENDMTQRELSIRIRNGDLDAGDLAVDTATFGRLQDAARGGQGGPTETAVHILPLTPELKDSVLKNGLPLFSTAGAAGLLVEDADPSVPDIVLAANDNQQVAQIGGLLRRFLKPRSRNVRPEDMAPTDLDLVGSVDDPLVALRKPTDDEVETFLRGEGAAGETHAVNINLARIDEPGDIKAAIDQTAGIFEGSINEARRGTITFEQTKGLADDLGMTVEQLLKRREGDAFNAEQALAARRILASSSRQLVDLAKKASGTGASEQDLLAFRRAMTLHAAIQHQVSGLTAEAGRALGAFRIEARGQASIDRNIRELIEAGGGGGLTRDMADKIATFGDTLTPAQLNKFARGGAGARTGNALLEVWINSLLSGPQTQMVNVVGNALVALWQIPERFLAQGIARLSGAEGVVRGESLALAYGLVEGMKEGMVLAGKTLRTGEPSSILTKLDQPQRKAISAEAFNLSGPAGVAVDILGETIRIPGRLLMSGDELFRTIGYRMELRAQALRQATTEGLSGDDLARRIVELTENPPEGIRLKAMDAGAYQTFTKPLGETGQNFQKMVNSMPALRLITPFIRTPANIMKFVGERTPLAPLSANVRAELAAGGARRQVQLARISMGSMAFTTGVALAAEGLITGYGPSDPEMRKIWLLNHQPNSIKIGNTWYSYGRLDPIASFLGIAADFTEISGQMSQAEADKLAVAAVMAVSRNVTSKTWLRGVNDFMEVMSDPDRYGRDYVTRLSGTLVPTLSAQIARTQDPTLRETRGDSLWDEMVTTWMSRLPGYSKDLPPRRNVFGEPIVLGGGLGPDIMSPVYTNDVKTDSVADELVRLNMPIRMPGRVVHGVELKPFEYARYVELQGKEIKIGGLSLKEKLRKVMASSRYLRQTDGKDGGKALMIRTEVLAYRDKAKAQLLKESELLRGAMRDKIKKDADALRRPFGDTTLP